MKSLEFMTELMVLLAEGKVTRAEFKQSMMHTFAMTEAVVGIGLGVFKLIEAVVKFKYFGFV